MHGLLFIWLESSYRRVWLGSRSAVSLLGMGIKDPGALLPKLWSLDLQQHWHSRGAC